MDVPPLSLEPPSAARTPHPPVAPRPVRYLCLLGIVAGLAGLGWIGTVHVRVLAPDFEYFYKAGAWLYHHGTLDRGYDLVNGQIRERGTLDWYWPAVTRFLTLLAPLGQRHAGYVWIALNLAATLATLRLLGRYLTGLPPRDWPVTQFVPFLLLAGYWYWEYRLDQINNFTLLFMVASFVCWQQRRPVIGGFWLGLAILLKLTPGLLVIWFALKRQYRAAVAAVLTVVLVGPGADAIALGPSEALAAYRTWAGNALVGGSQGALIAQQREMDWRNQGLGAVLCRWLHATSYATHFDNDPRVQADFVNEPPRTLNVVNLPLGLVAQLGTGLAVASLLGLVWLARRPARDLTAWQLRFEWALFVLAMLWLMPVMRAYHLVWALPTISVLCAGVHYAGWHRGWSRLTALCLLAFAGTQFALLSQTLVAAGSVLASVAVLALPTIVMLVRLGRRADALSAPAYTDAHPTHPATPAITTAPTACGACPHA
jgi:hypothetical protein